MELKHDRASFEIAHGSDVEFTVDEHTYFYGGVEYPSVTTLIKEWWPIHGFSYRKYPNATNRGIEIHELTALLDTGEITLDDVQDHVLECRQWVSLVDRLHFQMLRVEDLFVNATWGYAGTIDRIVEIPQRDEIAVIDIKSGSKAKWHALQIAAYAWSDPRVNAGYLVYMKHGKVQTSKVDLPRAMDAWAARITEGEEALEWKRFRQR